MTYFVFSARRVFRARANFPSHRCKFDDFSGEEEEEEEGYLYSEIICRSAATTLRRAMNE